MLRHSLRLILALLAASTTALALPIDCTKASSPHERTICADPFLLQTDARLDTLYEISSRFVAMGERGDLLDGQRTWVKERETCSTDKNCIRAAYAKRAAIFEAIIERAASHGPF